MENISESIDNNVEEKQEVISDNSDNGSNDNIDNNNGDTQCKSRKRVLTGKVVSNKMNKTIVVLIERRLKHKRYAKFITKSKKYKAHDEKNECAEGDVVTIMECRPISKHKTWRYIGTVKKSEL